jgi:hypothetical protein
MAASALLAKPGKMMAGWLRVRRHSGSSFQHHQRFCVLMVEDGCTVFHVFTSDASLKSREFLKIEVRMCVCACACVGCLSGLAIRKRLLCRVRISHSTCSARHVRLRLLIGPASIRSR